MIYFSLLIFLLIFLVGSVWGYEAISHSNTKFNYIFSDNGVDDDIDGAYDYLTINVGVNIMETAVYNISGSLYDEHECFLCHAFTEIPLHFGSRIVPLKFIQYMGAGRYRLMNLTLCDEAGNVLDLISEAYTTSKYTSNFNPHLAKFSGNISDHGVDFDNNGFYEYLTINICMDVLFPGEYALDGYLYDFNGNEIGWAINNKKFDVIGKNELNLDFNREKIYENKVNGPYYVRHLMLSGKNWSTMDYIPEYETGSYNYTDFSL